MANTLPRRFVMVAAPSVHAGIGQALRQAFQRPELWALRMYEKLIAKLDRR
ncbi:MAG TPA: hypothetical protein VGW34_14970 [Allosphingosinicella sp.]|nr:hypothetical protein [Allosphingosinicella sp.]